MQVKNTYIVKGSFGWQMLFETIGGNWFATDTGAFGQRDMSLKQISQDEAERLILETDSPKQK